MKKILFGCCLLISFTAKSQKSDSIFTKLFFEEGFNNTKVYVIGIKDTLLSKNITTNYDIGYALILKIPANGYQTICIKAGKFNRKTSLQRGKFYLISIKDNKLIIDEINEEPIYR